MLTAPAAAPAGDVHLCAVGHSYSASGLSPEQDPRYIVNVTSSAIINAAPPAGLAKVTHVAGKRIEEINDVMHFAIDDVFADRELSKVGGGGCGG